MNGRSERKLPDIAWRRDFLAECGAGEAQEDELIAYLENVYDSEAFRALTFPLKDEDFVPVWEGYKRKSESEGVFKVLSGALVQLDFPIQAGISRTEAYREATRRGIPPPTGDGQGLAMRDESGLELFFAGSPAGRLPVLLLRDREDFVSLIRALGNRNEPVAIPSSMGSLIIAGYNNWDRIRRYRMGWEREHPGADWLGHFPEFSERKGLYQDKFIILSDSPYSAVRAESLGLSEERWKDLSLRIRIEHETCHYFCKRVLSSMRNNLLDELLADFVGIRNACGRYRSDWLARFMGLEEEGKYRSGGRLENYTRGLSPEAFDVVCRLLRRAAMNLEKLEVEEGDEESYRILTALSFFTLDELASERAVDLFQEAYGAVRLSWKVQR